MRRWILGLVAAVLVAVGAGGATAAIDAQAPFVLIGTFWGALAFLAGAAGTEHYTSGPTPIELGVER